MVLKKAYNKLKEHVVDTTGILAASNPLFAFSENALTGLSDELSKQNRIDSSILFYFGAGYAFSQGRNLYHKLLKVFKGLVTAKNAQSLDEVVAGSVAGAISGGIAGTPLGYAIDAFRDLTEVNPSKRIPEKIRNLPKKLKLGIATGLLAASIGTVGAIYKATPEDYQGIRNYISQQIDGNHQGEQNDL